MGKRNICTSSDITLSGILQTLFLPEKMSAADQRNKCHHCVLVYHMVPFPTDRKGFQDMIEALDPTDLVPPANTFVKLKYQGQGP